MGTKIVGEMQDRKTAKAIIAAIIARIGAVRSAEWQEESAPKVSIPIASIVTKAAMTVRGAILPIRSNSIRIVSVNVA